MAGIFERASAHILASCRSFWREKLFPVYSKFVVEDIPRTRVGYELLDRGGGAEHRVGYHKLIPTKRDC